MEKEELLKILQENQHFIITTHESPDGDGLGSETALYLTLTAMNKSCYIVNSDPYEARYQFFLEDIPIISPSEWNQPVPIESCILLVVDTVPENTGKSMKRFLEEAERIIPIDHHDTMDPHCRFPGYYMNYASSTSEMIFEIIEMLDMEFSLLMANALFAGIMYDTGSFKYKKTSSETFRIASFLVEIGVNPFFVYTSIYESNTKASLLLFSRVMSSLNFYFDDQVSVLVMPKELLQETGARYEEGQQLINTPLGCKSVELSIFIKEDESGQKRCSLRSKGRFNCLHIAERFGGGGHETAAGFKIKSSFDATLQKVLDEIRTFFT